MGRAPCCEKVGLKRGRWTAAEDQILADYIAEHGEGSWRSLPKNAGLLRCGKSCRLRWINYLRADVKRGNISKEEEDIIIKLHATLGNRWSLIAGHLAGRTDNEIKNYWNSHLSRQIHTYRRKYTAGPDNTVTIDMSKLHSADNKRRGGRTPGWSPRSATTGGSSSRKSKNKLPDPEPEPESGDAKGASSPATVVTIDTSNKLRSDDDKRGGGRIPGRSPKSATSSSKTKSKQPDPEPEPESGDAKGASSPVTAATSSSASSPRNSDGPRSAVVDPDPNQPNSCSGSTADGPCSEDATGPWVLDPIELGDIWEAENEIDALMLSIGAGHERTVTPEGFDTVVGEAQVDDLFDMDWDGLAAHLWGEPEQIDQSAQLQEP